MRKKKKVKRSERFNRKHIFYGEKVEVRSGPHGYRLFA